MCGCSYCQITCGRCDCCESFTNSFANTTLTDGTSLTTLPLLVSAAGLEATFSNVGTELTLLAPTDAAFQAVLPLLGEWLCAVHAMVQHACQLACKRMLDVHAACNQADGLTDVHPCVTCSHGVSQAMIAFNRA